MHRTGNGRACSNLPRTPSRTPPTHHPLHRHGPSHRWCLTSKVNHNTHLPPTYSMTMDNLPRHPPATLSLLWRPVDLFRSPVHPPSSQHGIALHQNPLKNESDNIYPLGALRRKSIVYPAMQSHTHTIKQATLMRTTHLATAVTANAAHPTKRNGAKYTDARETTHCAVNTNAANGIRVLAAPAATNATAYRANTHAPHTLAVTTTFPPVAAGATILHPPLQRKNDGSRSPTNQ